MKNIRKNPETINKKMKVGEKGLRILLDIPSHIYLGAHLKT